MKKFNLTSEQLELFKWIHAKHLAAFGEGSEARERRTIEHVKKVVWDDEETCLKVYFDDGEWWHYLPDCTWY
jgi:hypothetical protein